MKHVHDTLYVLADGTNADPDDVSTGEDGVLRHKNGVPVALRDGGVPMTVGVAAVENKNVEAVKQGEAAKAEAADIAAAAKQEAKDGATPDETKDMHPEQPKKTYKTREAKAGTKK